MLNRRCLCEYVGEFIRETEGTGHEIDGTVSTRSLDKKRKAKNKHRFRYTFHGIFATGILMNHFFLRYFSFLVFHVVLCT